MDPLRLFDWKNSIEAIQKLQKLLHCTVCGKVAEEPQRLGRCDHHFCKGCAKGLENGTCPSCKVPAPPCEMQPDRIISDLAASCRDLQTLISAGECRTDSGGVPDGLRTPERGKRSLLPLKEICGAITNNNNYKQDSREDQGVAKGSAVSKPARSKGQEAMRESATKKGVKDTHRTPGTKTGTKAQASTTPLASKQEKKPKMSQASTTPLASKQEKKPKMSQASTTPLASKQEKNPKMNTPKSEVKKLARVSDLSALGMSPKTVAINRRNTKGETQLHVACIKGDKKRVEQLLWEGANPNTKDNAGWTPLHEVSSHGFEDIAHLLLRHGALVDPTGGSNETPLHDAVTQGQVALVRLLRAWGADDTSRNLKGQTPRYLTTQCLGAEELSAALDTPADPSLPRPAPLPPLMEKMVLLSSGLTRPQTKKLETLARMLRVKLMTEYSPEVTHIVTDCTAQRVVSTRTPKYMMGVVAGKWIIAHTWVEECLKTESAVSPGDHEAVGCSPASPGHPGAPALGRVNAQKLRPGLFSGCHMYLWGSFPGHQGRKGVEGLVRAGGGSVLARDPNAEAILEEEHRVPFHASPTGPLASCSHYIIYPDGPSQPQIKYDMRHFKSLPLAWLHHCVDTFTLPPPFK